MFCVRSHRIPAPKINLLALPEIDEEEDETLKKKFRWGGEGGGESGWMDELDKVFPPPFLPTMPDPPIFSGGT